MPDIEEFASRMAGRSKVAFTRVAPMEPLKDKFVKNMAQRKIGSVAATGGALIKLRREEFVGGMARVCQRPLAAMMDAPTMPSKEEFVGGMVRRSNIVATSPSNSENLQTWWLHEKIPPRRSLF